MTIVRIGRRGQLTVPREIRRQLSLTEGDHVAFVKQDDTVILLPLTKTLFDLRGSIPVSGPQDVEAIRRQGLGTHLRRKTEGWPVKRRPVV